MFSHIELLLAEEGRVFEAKRDAAVLQVQAWESDTLAQAGKLYRASTEIPMKFTIEICYASNNPVLLCDLEDSVIEVIDDN